MSSSLLKKYIFELMMNQNIIKKDPEGGGNLVIRKLVTYEKPTSTFGPGDDVDTELMDNGTVKVDGVETWKPDFDKEKIIKTPRRRRRRLA